METPAVFESADQGEAAQHQAGQAWEAFRLDPENVAIPSYPVCVTRLSDHPQVRRNRLGWGSVSSLESAPFRLA